MFVMLCTDTDVRDETVLFHNVCCFPWNDGSVVPYLLMSLLPAIIMFLFSVHHGLAVTRNVYCNIRWVASVTTSHVAVLCGYVSCRASCIYVSFANYLLINCL